MAGPWSILGPGLTAGTWGTALGTGSGPGLTAWTWGIALAAGLMPGLIIGTGAIALPGTWALASGSANDLTTTRTWGTAPVGGRGTWGTVLFPPSC